MKSFPNNIDPDKIDEVMRFLIAEFPDNSPLHHYDSGRIAETFVIVFEKENRLITIHKSFFDDNTVELIGPTLSAHGIVGLIASMKYHRVIVSSEGLQYESA